MEAHIVRLLRGNAQLRQERQGECHRLHGPEWEARVVEVDGVRPEARGCLDPPRNQAEWRASSEWLRPVRQP